MGNDGGSIPKRRELVKEAARQQTTTQLKESQKEQQDHLWKTDPLTNLPLSNPIVSDALGHLFSKDSIIEYLLPSKDGEAASKKKEHDEILKDTVTSLKDVLEVVFEVDSEGSGKWVCPVTNKQLGANVKAVYLVPCGHAFAEVAIKEVPGQKCLQVCGNLISYAIFRRTANFSQQCSTEYASNDVIPILPTVETDIARLTLRMQMLREKGLTHALKKASGSNKKRKKVESDSTNAEPAQVSGIKNTATATLTAKVLQEQEAKKCRTKNENLQSLFTTSNGKRIRKDGRNTDFMSRGYAIPGK